MGLAPQGGPPHPRCPDQAPHLDHLDPTSPRASRPMQDHGTPAPTVADNPGTPKASGTHHPLPEPPRANCPPWPPIQSTGDSPLAICSPTAGPRRSAHPWNGDRTTIPPDAETTPRDQGGDRRPAQTPTPPPAALRVIFRDGTGSSHGGSSMNSANQRHPRPNPSVGSRGPERSRRKSPPFSRPLNGQEKVSGLLTLELVLCICFRKHLLFFHNAK